MQVAAFDCVVRSLDRQIVSCQCFTIDLTI